MTYADLFTGIGCASLAASLNGLQHIFHCEYEKYPAKITAKYWPGVPNLGDIRTADFTGYAGMVDILAGGFPCQDISRAGKGAGIMGKKSSLWGEFYRCIQEVQPQYVIIENSDMLPKKGLDTILCDFAAIGYDAEWHCFSAAEFGANHIRKRTFILAYPVAQQRRGLLYCIYRAVQKKSRERVQMLGASSVHFLQFEQRHGEPPIFGTYDGLSKRLHVVKRMQALGNAMFWPIPYLIIKTIKEVESLSNDEWNTLNKLMIENL